MFKRPICYRCALAIIIFLAAANAPAQPAAGNPNRTAADDHREMMRQLGIKALRPGPSEDEKAPNHANYDESAANPFADRPASVGSILRATFDRRSNAIRLE